ncbi:Xyloglucan:xyloglucosyl transferase, partial [Bertholletia excelsa]
MAFAKEKIHLLSLLISCIVVVISSGLYGPPSVPCLTGRFKQVPINQGYSEFFGHLNIHLRNNGSNADIILDKSSGSGLVSYNKYNYGFFSAGIKLPSGFTSGVVVAFYLSNADVFPQNHDEIDFELLGHEKRRRWVLQTNIYGHGSDRTGREEKIYLWFDPTQEFHQYSILWNSHHIVFLVDNVPVRELVNYANISSFYPSKPMSVYATIWDGSDWATHGGKYPVNYKYSPFVASFGGMEMEGCIQHPTISCSRRSRSRSDPVRGQEFFKLSPEQINALKWARKNLLFYSYCRDTNRYKVLPPECKA